jgi:hypothetical protein
MVFAQNSPTAAERFLIKMALLQSPYELEAIFRENRWCQNATQ